VGKKGSRRANVYEALRQVGTDLRPKLGPSILIKPNFLSSTKQWVATHPDAVRGVLDFVVEQGIRPEQVIIAEGAHGQKSGEAYRNYGFTALEKEYDFPIRWLDLHAETAWEETPVCLADGTMTTVRMPKTVLDHPCTISLAVAKTHDAGIVTLSVKNMIQGCVHREDRIKVHGCHSHSERTLPREAQVIQANLTRVSRRLRADIAVIDGTVGVQGNGPNGDDTIELGIAVASADPYAADAVMAHAMGFARDDIGLLVYAQQLGLGVTDLADIEVSGPALASVVRPFTPHKTHDLQLQWRDEGIASQLGIR
jgi:uncharacterized protein (DUF362 family)